MNIWVDKVKPVPDSGTWTRVTSLAELSVLLTQKKRGLIKCVSLDGNITNLVSWLKWAMNQKSIGQIIGVKFVLHTDDQKLSGLVDALNK